MKLNNPLAKRLEKTVTTQENWYPTVDGKVKVSLVKLSNGLYRVCVWGGDDYGLERDFLPMERQEAIALYHKITNGTTQAVMLAAGMVPA